MSVQMTDDEKRNLKDIEYYSATVDAWYNSALERDKSLLMLSTGGIGFLITILTAVGASSVFELILYFFAVLLFGICLVAVLNIFHENKIHLENIIQNTAQQNDKKLRYLDVTAFYSFLFAIFISAIIGMSTASRHIKAIEMTNDKINTTADNSTSIRELIIESFNGASNIQPAIESFNGAMNLQPSSSTQAQSVATPSTTTESSAATPTPSATTSQP